MKLEFESNTTTIPFVGNNYAKDVSSPHAVKDVSQLLQAGIKAAQAGNRAEARILLLQVTEAEPENENAWLWMASISEYPEELLVFLNNVLAVNPNNARALEWAHQTKSMLAKNFVQRGVDASNEANMDLAKQCFLQAIVHDSQNEMAWLWLASIADSTEEKISHLQKVLSINPKNETAQASLQAAKNQISAVLLRKANTTAISGDREAASEMLQEVLRNAPELEEAWILKSYLADSFSEKITCYEKVLAINPDNDAANAGMASLKTMMLAKTENKKAAQFVIAAADAPEVEAAPISENQNATQELESAPPPAEIKDNSSENFQDGEASGESHDEANMKTEEFKLSDYAVSQVMECEPKTSDETQENFDDERPSKSFSVMLACPFCDAENESNAFVCHSCRTILTLSDLEMMLANTEADEAILRRAVKRMEAERTEREFEPQELKTLAVGYINLKSLRQGILLLQAAWRMNTNDVMLGSQINSLKIRLAEIEQQESIHSSIIRGKTIMVIDDSATVRKLISSKLEKVGHEVICAVDGVDALEKIKGIVPDLILLDINMPRMDGYQVCKIIRTEEATKDVPIVMISGNDGFFDKVRGRMSGTSGYITKPFGPEALMKTVENYIV
ncbi:MAG: response regulator [Pyrinomonadaceae bacterium]